MPESIGTQCKKCRRAVYVEHLDRDGCCCFCSTIGGIPVEEATDTRPALKTDADGFLKGGRR